MRLWLLLSWSHCQLFGMFYSTCVQAWLSHYRWVLFVVPRELILGPVGACSLCALLSSPAVGELLEPGILHFLRPSDFFLLEFFLFASCLKEAEPDQQVAEDRVPCES